VDRPLFTVISDVTVSGHRYVHVAPANAGTFAKHLAPLIRAHYFDEAVARARLVRAAQELMQFSGKAFEIDQDAVNEAMMEERDALLPEVQSGKRPEHLSVQRSEFGEILASEVLKQIFGTHIPASRIKHKEIPDQPTRGADVIGLEDIAAEKASLVLAEAKASQDRKSPPGVVADMITKLESLVTNRRTLIQELCWLRDHAEEEYAAICAKVYASYMLRKDYFQIVVSPILVRSAATHHQDDPGEFKSNPQRFGRAVRWVSIVVDGDILQVAQEVYRIVREEEA
jgi:hypothetical protein